MTDDERPDHSGERVVGIPVEKGDGRVLCYSCAQDEEWVHGKDDWMPIDVENYPVQCEVCGVTLIHETQE